MPSVWAIAHRRVHIAAVRLSLVRFQRYRKGDRPIWIQVFLGDWLMRPSFIAFLAGTFVVSAAESAPSDGRAQICINRPGENGRLNITPVTIRLSGAAELTILGEQEVCLRKYLGTTATTITLRFPFPYGGPYDQPQYWETAPVSVNVSAGETMRITLCPRDQNRNDPEWTTSRWHEMWVLVPPENRTA